MIPDATSEGTVAFRDWKTWYRISGDLSTGVTPLVVAHGGPGCTHDYVLSIAALSERGRPVIHYDQLGAGNSTHLREKGADFWTVQLFLDELDNLLEKLAIKDNYHLLGQSWGGMLGAEHAIRQPEGLRSLVISNSPASMTLWVAEAKKLRAAMPKEERDALDRHEAAGTTDDPEYLAATAAFYARHVCRVVPNPPEFVRPAAHLLTDGQVCLAMTVPTSRLVIGTLRVRTVVAKVQQM